MSHSLPIKKYYMHSNPSQGYQIKQKYQLPDQHHSSFDPIIRQINHAYHIYSIRQHQTLKDLPQNTTLFLELSCLIILPLLKAVILTDFCTIFEQYLCVTGFLIWRVVCMMRVSDRSREEFEEARVELMEKLEQIREKFNKSSKDYGLIFENQQTDGSERMIRYVGFYRKKIKNQEEDPRVKIHPE